MGNGRKLSPDWPATDWRKLREAAKLVVTVAVSLFAVWMLYLAYPPGVKLPPAQPRAEGTAPIAIFTSVWTEPVYKATPDRGRIERVPVHPSPFDELEATKS